MLLEERPCAALFLFRYSFIVMHITTIKQNDCMEKRIMRTSLRLVAGFAAMFFFRHASSGTGQAAQPDLLF